MYYGVEQSTGLKTIKPVDDKPVDDKPEQLDQGSGLIASPLLIQ